MYKVRLILKNDFREQWFKDLANSKLDELGEKSVWYSSPTGKVWTHKRDHQGKVEFLMKTDGTADYIKTRHISGNHFKEVRTVSDFIQWTLAHLSDFVQRIELILE